ncbi:chromosome segregation in meiosis- protein [Kalmusia sp. IMI 367209]|nr:chromosome segregation in meiosis- protein [Kalmusia sp. IMI 367209]
MATINHLENPLANDIPSDDELDAILNGTLNGQDIFDTSNIQAQVQPSRPQKPAGDDAGLGIDEEIKVVKKRQPIPKLDEIRLLSDPGIPKLRRISKERLKLKGKGHEYGDIARMLNMYQLWLDDLYPRAKFADGLAMIEKLGHSKRMQLMRKEWIDEGKPRHTVEDEDEANIVITEEHTKQGTDQMEGIEQGNTIQGRLSEEEPQQELPNGTNDAEAPAEDPDEDELDALLAESTIAPQTGASAAAARTEDPFADAMEAMAEMEEMW